MGTGFALKGFGFGDVFPKSLRSGDEWQILNSLLSSSRFVNLNGFIWALSSFMHCLRTFCLLHRDTAVIYTAQWIYLQLRVIVHVYYVHCEYCICNMVTLWWWMCKLHCLQCNKMTKRCYIYILIPSSEIICVHTFTEMTIVFKRHKICEAKVTLFSCGVSL